MTVARIALALALTLALTRSAHAGELVLRAASGEPVANATGFSRITNTVLTAGAPYTAMRLAGPPALNAAFVVPTVYPNDSTSGLFTVLNNVIYPDVGGGGNVCIEVCMTVVKTGQLRSNATFQSIGTNIGCATGQTINYGAQAAHNAYSTITAVQPIDSTAVTPVACTPATCQNQELLIRMRNCGATTSSSLDFLSTVAQYN